MPEYLYAEKFVSFGGQFIILEAQNIVLSQCLLSRIGCFRRNWDSRSLVDVTRGKCVVAVFATRWHHLPPLVKRVYYRRQIILGYIQFCTRCYFT